MEATGCNFRSAKRRLIFSDLKLVAKVAELAGDLQVIRRGGASVRLLQFSPRATTRDLRIRMRANSQTWSTASIRPGDVGSLRSWFEQNRDSSEISAIGRVNWG